LHEIWHKRVLLCAIYREASDFLSNHVTRANIKMKAFATAVASLLAATKYFKPSQNRPVFVNHCGGTVATHRRCLVNDA
jgi:hypothetical protein